MRLPIELIPIRVSWELKHPKNLYEIPATNILFLANKLQETHDLRLHFGEQGKLNMSLVSGRYLGALVREVDLPVDLR